MFVHIHKGTKTHPKTNRGMHIDRPHPHTIDTSERDRLSKHSRKPRAYKTHTQIHPSMHMYKYSNPNAPEGEGRVGEHGAVDVLDVLLVGRGGRGGEGGCWGVCVGVCVDWFAGVSRKGRRGGGGCSSVCVCVERCIYAMEWRTHRRRRREDTSPSRPTIRPVALVKDAKSRGVSE